MADLLEASVNELRLLEPPEGMADEYDEWLGLRAEMTSAMREVQTAGTVYDEQAIDAGLQRIDAAIAEADPLAEELGFAECSPTGVIDWALAAAEARLALLQERGHALREVLRPGGRRPGAGPRARAAPRGWMLRRARRGASSCRCPRRQRREGGGDAPRRGRAAESARTTSETSPHASASSAVSLRPERHPFERARVAEEPREAGAARVGDEPDVDEGRDEARRVGGEAEVAGAARARDRRRRPRH